MTYIYADRKPLIGDVVECTVTCESYYTKGSLYSVKDISNSTLYTVLDDKGSTTNGFSTDNFKVVKTLPSDQARVGDYLFKTSTRNADISPRDIVKVAKILPSGTFQATDSTKYPDKGCTIYTDHCVVLQTEETHGKPDKSHRNASYYALFQQARDAGIKIEYLLNDGRWTSTTALSDFTLSASIIQSKQYQLRIAGTPDDCPDVNTQAYWDYWKPYMKPHMVEELIFNGNTCKPINIHHDYTNSTWDSWNSCRPTLFRHPQLVATATHTTNQCIDIAPGPYELSAVSEAPSILDKITELTNQIEKGPQMNELKLTIDGVEIILTSNLAELVAHEEKTDLEESPSIVVFIYNEDGEFIGGTEVQSNKEAKKLLQHPSMIGNTIVTYTKAKVYTTSIPVVEIKED